MEFHERLIELRKEKGFTREEFANYLGISKYTLRNYEMGKTEPGHIFLKYLSDIFQVSIDYLLCMTDDRTPPDKVSVFSASEIEHIKNYRALDAPGRKHVDTILQWETWRMEQMQEAKAPAAKPLRLIQYYQRLASAGTGQYVFDNIPTEQIKIPDIPEYRKVQFALGVNGLSMEPLYSHGDILLIEPTQEIQPGEIGIFLHNGESFVKELGDGVLHSLNDLYGDIEITEDTRCVGRVIDKLDAPISVSEELGEKLRALAKKAAEKHA